MFPLDAIKMHGMSSYSVHSLVHSPVHSPVHGPEFSFYTNPNHIATQHIISAAVYPTVSEKPGLIAKEPFAGG